MRQRDLATLPLFKGEGEGQGEETPPLAAREALVELAQAPPHERGATFTRREVVRFMLDLAGYRVERDLRAMRLLEPAFGQGDFLLPAVERLVTSWLAHGGQRAMAGAALRDAVRAVELHEASFHATECSLRACLEAREIPERAICELLRAWLHQGDFLLLDGLGRFSHVVGNPPWLRPERIPPALLALYRETFSTMFDRSDLYVPFIEKGLHLLAPDGVLAFICSDRWTKNQYGGPLRELVAEGFDLTHYIDMVDTPAFQGEVLAYPAITLIRQGKGRATRVARRPPINEAALAELSAALEHAAPGGAVEALPQVAVSREPWLLEGGGTTALLRRLEGALPTLEEAGCVVSIGVATGCDRVYIGPFDALPVEDEAKLPLLMAPDIRTGEIVWSGQGLINPFLEDGRLIDLTRAPRLARYFAQHEAALRARHVARKNPARWYRTIDRVYPSLLTRPKILIPDIKGSPNVVLDEGRFYPHHNLYHVTSDTWDLKALALVLSSQIAHLFVEAYSVKMKGGFLRFQAQNLRRIRLPRWEGVTQALRRALVDAWEAGDPTQREEAVARLYGLTTQDGQLLADAFPRVEAKRS